MQIYLVRHGETVWNRARRLQGQADSPLTLRGVRLAIGYGHHLAGILAGPDTRSDLDSRFDDVGFHMSPLGRTRQTASLIADCLGVDPERFEVDPLLAEHNVGAFAGLVWDEIEARHGVTLETWRDWTTRPPEGETRQEVFDRARAWLDQPRSHRTVVLVTHGGLSRTFRAAYLNLDEADRAALEPHEHGRYYRLEGGRCEEIVVDDTPPSKEAPLG